MMRASVWNATFRALALDVARAQLEFALVLTAGRDLVDLESVRGPTRRAWNRLIGEQAVNVGIVILAANTAETILLNAAICQWPCESPRWWPSKSPRPLAVV